MPSEVLLGNQAIGFALAAEGLSVMAAYPGTPSSEILPSVVKFNKMKSLGIYTEWSVNEKIALDQAFAGAMTGLRSAVAMKQVGLNVAADSFFSIAYMGVTGGLIIVSADDPGPHSSQTEQDSRLMAYTAKVPVLDPSTPSEAMAMVAQGFELSEEFQVPVLLRPGIRICHAKQLVEIPDPKSIEANPLFKRDPSRWAATPRFRFIQHRELNRKLEKIAERNNHSPFNRLSMNLNQAFPLGILTAGAAAAAVTDILADAGLDEEIPVLTLGATFPFPDKLVNHFLDACRLVLVLEETHTFIELLASRREKLLGRLNGFVPKEGELTPEVIHQTFIRAQDRAGLKPLEPLPGNQYAEIRESLSLPVMKPRLCPGCGHRAAFYAIKKAYPKAFFPSDIGCYTLGINLRAVDTVLDMGSGITLASGLYHALSQGGEEPVIVATMGDSTFYHSGITSLVNAVYNGAKFVLVLLDNGTTAMTGMQPTPNTGVLADGTMGRRVDLKRLIGGLGIDYLVSLDAYDIPQMLDEVKKAREYTASPDGSVAVIIAAHPCRIAQPKQEIRSVKVNDNCIGCMICTATFECPAMTVPKKGEKVQIDPKLCVSCGVCVHVCPEGALEVTDAA